MVYSTHDVLHMAACFAFILSAVICGAIRWFHMCRPYNQRGDYFYPARPGVTLAFAGFLLQLPYVLNVNDNDTFLYVNAFNIFYYPLIYSLLIQKYFNGSMRHKLSLLYLLLLPTALLFGCLFLGITPLYEVSAYRVSYYVLALWGVFLFFAFLGEALWLKKKIDDYHHERYSTPEDFPYRFAKRILFSPFITLALMWIVYVTQNRDVKMFVDWFMAFYNVAFLCLILHPQRNLMADEQNNLLNEMYKAEENFLKKAEEEIECEKAETEKPFPTENSEATSNEVTTEKKQENECSKANSSQIPSQIESYKEMVIHEIRDNHAFLDSHYSLQKLSDSIKLGRTYTSQACKALGGFYYLVNKFRLEYAEQYKREHPNATKEVVAEESGFTDRNAYRRAMESISPSDAV